MRPETIKKTEDEFFKNLTGSTGGNYTLKATTDIGNGFKIYSIRRNYDSYYYKTKTTKKSICLHFTVGNIKSDAATLTKQNDHVSVPYLVDRSGRIYELFPDSEWSYHLGKHAVGGNEDMSKLSIGIEISNYGPLKLSGQNLLDDYGEIYCKVSEEEFYTKQPYRTRDYYASMTDAQIDAVVALIKYLGKKHDIPMNFKSDDEVFASAEEAISFRGVFYHSNVRNDKFDWPFTPSLKAVIAKCTNEQPSKVETQQDATMTETPVEPTKVDVLAPELDEPEQKPETPKVESPAPATENVSSTKPKSLLELILSFLAQLFGFRKK